MNLAGGLSVTLLDGFAPTGGATRGTFGDEFVVLTADAISGTFAKDAPLVTDAEEGIFLVVDTTTTDVTLRAIAALPGDANYDRVVDLRDASILLANWQAGGGVDWAGSDFDNDGDVDSDDAQMMVDNWGQGYGGLPAYELTAVPTSLMAVVPEPGTLSLLGLGGLALLRRRK